MSNNINQTNTQESDGQEIKIGQQVEPTSTFTVAQSISSGKMPNNNDLVSSFKEIEEPLSRQAQEKSGVEGRIALQTQQILQHARELMTEKNTGETLDKIRTHTKESGAALSQIAHNEKESANPNWTDEKVLELRQLLRSFRSTATALARNNSFRQHFIELIQLFQAFLFDFSHTKIDQKLNQAKTRSTIEDTVQATSQSTIEDTLQTTSQTQQSPNNYDIDQHPEDGTQNRVMTEEERTHAFQKLRTIMFELGKSSEYKDLIQRLGSFFENNGKYIVGLASQSKNHTKSSFTALGDDIQELLESFSGNVSLKPLRERINQVILNIQNNPEVKDFFVRSHHLFKETVSRPEDQEPQQIDNEIRDLSHKAQDLLKKPEYREDSEVILRESRGFFDRIKEDKHLSQLGSDFQSLRKEIMLNEQGQIDFASIRTALPALKNVLLPALMSAIKTIPITPVNTDNEKYKIEVTNLSLSSDDLLPENANIHFANDIFFDFSGQGNDRFDSNLSLSLNDFTTNLRDMHFKFERKKMPRVSDEGVADVSVVGTTIKMKWKMEKVEDRISFQVEKVSCTMRQLNTNVKEAQHRAIDRLALKMFNTQIKTAIQVAVEKALRERLEKFSINTSTHEISTSMKNKVPSMSSMKQKFSSGEGSSQNSASSLKEDVKPTNYDSSISNSKHNSTSNVTKELKDENPVKSETLSGKKESTVQSVKTIYSEQPKKEIVTAEKDLEQFTQEKDSSKSHKSHHHSEHHHHHHSKHHHHNEDNKERPDIESSSPWASEIKDLSLNQESVQPVIAPSTKIEDIQPIKHSSDETVAPVSKAAQS